MTTESDRKAFQLMRESGVLNENATLREVMDVTEKLIAEGESAGDDYVIDVYIYKHFIFIHQEGPVPTRK